MASQTNLAGVGSFFDDGVAPPSKRKGITVQSRATFERIVTLPSVEHVVATQPEQCVAVLGSAQNVVLLRPGNRRYLQGIECCRIDNRAIAKLDLLDLRAGKVVIPRDRDGIGRSRQGDAKIPIVQMHERDICRVNACGKTQRIDRGAVAIIVDHVVAVSTRKKIDVRPFSAY